MKKDIRSISSDSCSSNSDSGSQSYSDNEECGCNPVLVADDNEFNLVTFRQILKNYNLEADGASNGQEAVEKFRMSLRCCPYRVVFMDVNMPIMDGLEATRNIVKIIKDFSRSAAYNESRIQAEIEGKNTVKVEEIPIIALTANDTTIERQRCHEAGMSSFLSKPPDFVKLKQTLADVFGKEYSPAFK